MHADPNQLASIRSALPKEGLFAEKGFLFSPDPFPIDAAFAKELVETWLPYGGMPQQAAEKAKVFPQGLKPIESWCFMSEPRLRPPQEANFSAGC